MGTAKQPPKWLGVTLLMTDRFKYGLNYGLNYGFNYGFSYGFNNEFNDGFKRWVQRWVQRWVCAASSCMIGDGKGTKGCFSLVRLTMPVQDTPIVTPRHDAAFIVHLGLASSHV
ncbi:hypothetical protein RJ55_06783 [Drechmeria coniospora]|nr:hypothetical protein RJ55_06783 [Drechmeria coniospora]